MRIIIITQDDPFYLSKNLSYLIEQLPDYCKIVGCVVDDASPFGKKTRFADKVLQTYKVFGIRFFVYYSFKFLCSKLFNFKGVQRILEKNNIPLIILSQTINSPESISKLKGYSPDILVSILGGQIFKREVIDLAPNGCLNLHTALLPKYRGLMPSFWVLKNEEEYTGVSVFYVDEGIDSGPILVQKKIAINDMSQEDLIKHTKKVGMDAIIEAIEDINQNSVNLIPNDDRDMSYYSFPTKSDVKEFYRRGKRFF